MAKKPESNFRARIYPELKALPNTTIFPIQQKAIRGHPDFILCCMGKFVALELKTNKGKLTKLQEHVRASVWASFGNFLVATPSNWKETYEQLMYIAKGE